jgi:hypothetical protein
MDAIVSLSIFLSNCLPFPDFSVSYLLEFDRLEVVAMLSGFIILQRQVFMICLVINGMQCGGCRRKLLFDKKLEQERR